jgi:hypothetical protein
MTGAAKNTRVPPWRRDWRSFADYEAEGSQWITPADVHFFPDYLPKAAEKYSVPLKVFGQLAKSASDSVALFRKIFEVKLHRIQLLRIFRRYVSPGAPLEILKRRDRLEENLAAFGASFRPISMVRRAYASRPNDDDAMFAVLWEHQERGKPGQRLTESFFAWIRTHLTDVEIAGGRDIPMATKFPDYGKKRGVDFMMSDQNGMLAVGFIHYDSDRGGAQEADRVGQYREAAEEIVSYLHRRGQATKLVFINDGPGLLAGAMWKRYAELEKLWPFKIQVNTLKMMDERLTLPWLYS